MSRRLSPVRSSTVSPWGFTRRRSWCGMRAPTASRCARWMRRALRLVKSLSQAGGARLIAARAARPFASVQDIAARAALERTDLEALAAAGAFASLSGNRHFAFWEVAGTERALPLAPAAARGTDLTEGRPLLAAPTEGQGIAADYAALGLTLGRHPLALLRTRLRAAS